MTEFDSVDRQHMTTTIQRLAGNPPRLAHGDASAPLIDRSADGVSCRLGDASCASAHAARTVYRSASGRVGLAERSLLQLQRHYGNRYVGHVLREAVVDAPAPHAGPSIEQTIERERGAGQGMDGGTQGRMESAFGSSFSHVRIHTDAPAHDLSLSLNARAFTTGSDIFFRQGEYNPGSASGRELLAHELTHVVQQTGAVQRKMTVSEPGDPHEVEADQMARAVIAQEHVSRQPEAAHPDDDERKKIHAKGAGADGAHAEEDDQPKPLAGP